MADLLPSASGPDDGPDSPDDRDPRVIGLDSDEADELLAAISSSTARSVLSALHESPATATDLTNEGETSLQNVQYHLGNLEAAGLIEVVSMRYSEKGREMNVFGPADRALVVVAGRSDETSGLKRALSQLIGSVGVLGIGAAVINRLADSRSIFPFVATTGAGDGGVKSGGAENLSYQVSTGGNATTTTTATQTQTATPSPTTVAETATEAGDGGGYNVAETTTTPEATQTMTEQAATATPTPEATTTAAHHATDTAMALTSGAPGIGETLAGFSPGLLFFLGGMTVLTLWIGLGLAHN